MGKKLLAKLKYLLKHSKLTSKNYWHFTTWISFEYKRNTKAFFSLQTNKSPGDHENSCNFFKSCFGSFSKPLLHIFRLSLDEGIFPDDLEAAKVTPIFKTGDENDFSAYRPISVLSCFCKILEKTCIKDLSIIYQSIIYLIKNSFVFSKVT